MSVATAVAESTHHSAQRQKTTRAKGEARDVLHGRVPEAPPTQGSRPPCLGEPRGPQERIHDVVPMVQILDTPVPQLVDQLADVIRFSDTLLPVPEQAIEVPKILLDDVPVRTAVRDTQLVEQLVEVPTIVSYSSLQRTMEQNVDIPVPCRRGRNACLLGFPPGQCSTAQHGSLERIVEQFVDIPVSGGLQDFRPGPSSSSSHVPARVSEALDEPGEGFFRTFPQILKSAKLGSHSSLRVPASVSPSTPAPQLEDAPVKTHFWNRRTWKSVWKPLPGVKVVWVGTRDEEGVFYHWHKVTRVSRYDLPPLSGGRRGAGTSCAAACIAFDVHHQPLKFHTKGNKRATLGWKRLRVVVVVVADPTSLPLELERDVRGQQKTSFLHVSWVGALRTSHR